MEVQMGSADIARSVMISLATLLAGMGIFIAWQTYRDRDDPPPARLSLKGTLVFAVGHFGLLVHLVVTRLEHLGEYPLTPSGYIAFAVLIINVIALWILICHGKDQHTDVLIHKRPRRLLDIALNVILRRDAKRMQGADVPPLRHSRWYECLGDGDRQKLADEVREQVERGD